MDKGLGHAASFLIVGLLAGSLLTTASFALLVRRQNQNSAAGNAVTVLKLGHSLDQNHPVHQSMVRMSELLSQKSGGTILLEIYPNAQLGSETENLEQLQRGALALTKTSTAPLESFIPELGIFGVPYVFRDDDHCWEVMNGPIGKDLLVAGTDVGLRGLCYFDAGARSFYTIDTAVMHPRDLQGLKIRVQKSKMAMDLVEALGGSPTPIPWGELYTALQQRLVDGAENNPPSFYFNRHFEVCKHLTLDEHARVPDMLLISEKVWQRLPGQVQQWVLESAQEAAEFQRQLWQQENAAAIEAVAREGVTVHVPDTAPFREQVKPLYERLKGTSIGDLIDRIQNM